MLKHRDIYKINMLAILELTSIFINIWIYSTLLSLITLFIQYKHKWKLKHVVFADFIYSIEN